jgi:outer membrane protein
MVQGRIAVADAPPSQSPAPASRGRIVTLAEAVQAAATQQPSIRQARAATDAAVARIGEARAGYLPQIGLTGTYRRETGNYQPTPGVIPADVPTTPTSLATYNYYNFGLTATQLLYDFGQTTGRWRAAESSADAARAMESVTRNQVLLNVRNAFFLARGQKALFEVARGTLTNQEKHLVQIRGLVAVGSDPAIDLAIGQTNVAVAVVGLTTAENNYGLAKVQLNQAMGVLGTTDYDVSDEWMSPVAGEEEPGRALFTEAASKRPELASYRFQEEAEQHTIRSIEGAYGPTLGAIATGTLGGVSLPHLVPDVGAGATLSWAIFQGGLTKEQVREAKANLAGIKAQTDAERLQVRADVESARLAVRAARLNTASTQVALANAREQLRLAEGRYATGLGNGVELSDAQLAESTAAGQVVQAAYTLSAARAQLLFALGR